MLGANEVTQAPAWDLEGCVSTLVLCGALERELSCPHGGGVVTAGYRVGLGTSETLGRPVPVTGLDWDVQSWVGPAPCLGEL